uniref:MADS-box domain-containing protein n=1 Tax=Spongospora subterranea TaxID=70186 RepID=A0A0H5QZE7_9EUKA|eukprot:CRZ00939.1 hypothetical protein [Spongospora subterranea]
MGRKRIDIERIKDDKRRNETFRKRKAGLLKKAQELGTLCDCEVALILINDNKITAFSNSNIDGMLNSYFHSESGVEFVSDPGDAVVETVQETAFDPDHLLRKRRREQLQQYEDADPPFSASQALLTGCRYLPTEQDSYAAQAESDLNQPDLATQLF